MGTDRALPQIERPRRRHRRKKEDVVYLEIELQAAKVSRLAEFGYLRRTQLNNPKQIRNALCWFLDHKLGTPGWTRS